MDYAHQPDAAAMPGVTGGLSAAKQARPTPELGRLKAAAQRVALATNNVDNFLVRFNGPTPEAPSASEPMNDSYRNDLASLFDAIDQLESVVSSLEHIG